MIKQSRGGVPNDFRPQNHDKSGVDRDLQDTISPIAGIMPKRGK